MAPQVASTVLPDNFARETFHELVEVEHFVNKTLSQKPRPHALLSHVAQNSQIHKTSTKSYHTAKFTKFFAHESFWLHHMLDGILVTSLILCAINRVHFVLFLAPTGIVLRVLYGSITIHMETINCTEGTRIFYGPLHCRDVLPRDQEVRLFGPLRAHQIQLTPRHPAPIAKEMFDTIKRGLIVEVCVRERERERESVCVRERGRGREGGREGGREKERERERDRERERECVCVCVCV